LNLITKEPETPIKTMPSKQINLQRILFVALAFSLVILYVLSWVDVVSDPTQLTGSDFMAFYAAGRSMFEHTPAAAYDLASLKASEESVLGFRIADQDVNPFVHPPLILPVLWLVAHFNYLTAFYLWALFTLILCMLNAHIAIKLFSSTNKLNRAVLWAGTFLFFPLFISLVNGQDSALLLLGAMLWYYGLTQNSNRMAGLGLALTTIRPQIALLLAIPMIFNARSRKVWWWFCIGSAVLVVFSVALLGQGGVRNFINILSVSASGEGYKINEVAMINLIGMVKRLNLGFNAATIRTVGWVGSLAGLIILCLVWGKAPAITDKHISLAIIIAVFTSPHLHYHDLALLIIPIFVVIRKLTAAGKVSMDLASLIPLFVSLIFILTYSISQLNYSIVYLVELALLITLWLVKNKNEFSQSSAD
jgi:hypothetical protein